MKVTKVFIGFMLIFSACLLMVNCSSGGGGGGGSNSGNNGGGGVTFSYTDENFATLDSGQAFAENQLNLNNPNGLQDTINYIKTRNDVSDCKLCLDSRTMVIFHTSGMKSYLIYSPKDQAINNSNNNYNSPKLYDFMPYQKINRNVSSGIIPLNKTALIFAPVQWDFKENLAAFQADLESAEYWVNPKINDEASFNYLVSTLEQNNYGVIYISSHGSVDENGHNSIIINPAMHSANEANTFLNSVSGKYRYDIFAAKMTNLADKYVYLRSGFFRYFQYSNSIVFLNACLSAKDGTNMYLDFIRQGATAFIGWKDLVQYDVSGATAEMFFDLMKNPGQSVSATVTQIKNDPAIRQMSKKDDIFKIDYLTTSGGDPNNAYLVEPSDNNIIGTWFNSNYNAKYVFRADNTVTYYNYDDNCMTDYRYTINQNLLTMTSISTTCGGSLGSTHYMLFFVSNNRLCLAPEQTNGQSNPRYPYARQFGASGPNLIGKWLFISGSRKDIWEFESNGTYQYQTYYNNEHLMCRNSGTYSTIDGRELITIATFAEGLCDTGTYYGGYFIDNSGNNMNLGIYFAKQ